MALIENTQTSKWSPRWEESPFAEATPEAADGARTAGFAPWSESDVPFNLGLDETVTESEADHLLAEAFAALRDDIFDEPLSFLAEEVEKAVSERFTGETPAN